MVVLSMVVASVLLLVASRWYKRRLRRQFSAGLTETQRRSMGQVTGYGDAAKAAAHHGLIADAHSGRYYAQHRHPDNELQR